MRNMITHGDCSDHLDSVLTIAEQDYKIIKKYIGITDKEMEFKSKLKRLYILLYRKTYSYCHFIPHLIYHNPYMDVGPKIFNFFPSEPNNWEDKWWCDDILNNRLFWKKIDAFLCEHINTSNFPVKCNHTSVSYSWSVSWTHSQFLLLIEFADKYPEREIVKFFNGNNYSLKKNLLRTHVEKYPVMEKLANGEWICQWIAKDVEKWKENSNKIVNSLNYTHWQDYHLLKEEFLNYIKMHPKTKNRGYQEKITRKIKYIFSWAYIKPLNTIAENLKMDEDLVLYYMDNVLGKIKHCGVHGNIPDKYCIECRKNVKDWRGNAKKKIKGFFIKNQQGKHKCKYAMLTPKIKLIPFPRNSVEFIIDNMYLLTIFKISQKIGLSKLEIKCIYERYLPQRDICDKHLAFSYKCRSCNEIMDKWREEAKILMKSYKFMDEI